MQLLYSDNQVIYYEWIINIFSVVINFGCMIGGLFGMNVQIPGQDSNMMFPMVVLGVICASILFCVVTLVVQKKK